MLRINKLAAMANKVISERTERLIQAFVTYDEELGIYKADCRIWNGSWRNKVKSVVTQHDTEGDALKAVSDTLTKYPNKMDNGVYNDEGMRAVFEALSTENLRVLAFGLDDDDKSDEKAKEILKSTGYQMDYWK